MAITNQELEDTGERMIPAFHKTHMVYGEHIVRYEAARALVKGKKVLDVASGSGYGTALLASSASEVIGVDLDKTAIAYAKKHYGSDSATFVVGSGTDIPLEDNSVDVVVSFETIEHIEDYKKFLSEVKRVLKADGLFLLSTPNDIEFPETNHFHIHEFEQNELEKLVKKYFKNTKSYFQATWLYNALLDETELSTEWQKPIQTMHTAPVGTSKAIYFFMLCSNRKIIEKLEPLAAISEHYSARKIQEYEQSVRKHIEDQGVIIKHLEDTINDISPRLEAAKRTLNNIYDTKTWKIVSKLHNFKKSGHDKS